MKKKEKKDTPTCFQAVKGDKVLSSIRHVCNVQLHYIITFNSKLDLERLAKAIRLTVDAEPILGCRFIENRKGPFWQRREDLDDLEFCRLTETDCPKESLIRCMSSDCDPYNDPMVQAHIFRAETDTLCIRVNHIVSDAGGLKEYVRLLSSFYATLKINPAFKPQSNLPARRSSKQITDLLSLYDRLKILLLSLRNWHDSLFPRKNWTFPFLHLHPATDCTFLLHHIPPDQCKRIKHVAGHHGVTVNDILTACILRGLYKIIQPHIGTPLRIGVTVDLRRYRANQQGEALTNLAKMFLLNIGHDIGDTLLETIALVHGQMKDRKANYLGLDINKNSIFSLQWLPAWASCTIHNLTSKLNYLIGPKDIPPWFTNMGLIKGEDIAFDEIEVTDAVIIPPVIYAPLLAIGATGFGETITLSTGFSKNLHDEKKVKDLFLAIDKEIASLPREQMEREVEGIPF
ncbi:MAG: condensation domain-containing protein [Candidatus Electrothrix sp. Rat3]|nr:condensation domain-containing protein [Candidatus Electrothrix rattekaaiensis]